ncbi:DUF4878 domain-containing protein [Clostridium botulinum]|uniref:DUF4878 domain-containing protein n=2 Tax=Clostridium botulinum TaxID=1491 RepID=A0A846I0A1_CLOBO|nr:hypothetical protein [Clostridium botulinum]AJD27897.1 lumazine-binding domain protein [Clostridium botulinum CDC_297]ACQ53482.1 putative lipoprotein [Clostridium botulinum Ba4 str. 657]AJE12160.1 lumazine-binding domain protein [Clostridium botulinum CDC_1436]APR01331.1 lumazine-binding domain protein [Clostridium botulinum]APU61256.1 lumazine-binding domain protein [Clostridium botulinum]
MKSTFKKLMPIIFIAILSISLTGCSPKPDETVKGFFGALKQQDIKKASTFINVNSFYKELKVDEFDSKEQEKIVKAVLSKFDYSLGDVEKNGNTATAKVSVTSIDLGKITIKTIDKILPNLIDEAFSQGKIDEKKQQAVIIQHMLNSINDPNAPKIKTNINVKLVKGDKGWLIEPDEELANALSGNLYSVAKKFQSK